MKAICDRFTALRDGRTTGSGDVASTPVDRIVAMMVGRDVEELYPRTPRSAGETVLSMCDLAGVAKPEWATLELRRGEVVGIAGIIGAGRTELLRHYGARPGRPRFGSRRRLSTAGRILASAGSKGWAW